MQSAKVKLRSEILHFAIFNLHFAFKPLCGREVRENGMWEEPQVKMRQRNKEDGEEESDGKEEKIRT